MKVEAQLAASQECGITLREGLTVDEFFDEWPRENIEQDPIGLILCIMGGLQAPEFMVRRSGQLCHIDPECIEDTGDYVRRAQDVVQIMQGELPLTKLSDEIDIEKGVARLQIELDGKTHRWDQEVLNDWMDPTFYERFAALIAPRQCSRALLYLDAGGQDFFIAAIEPARLKQLRQLTGRDWQLIPTKAGPQAGASSGILQGLKSAWARILKRS